MSSALPPRDFDAFWKEALDLYLRELTAFAVPDVYAAVDWSAGVESLDTELLAPSRAAVNRRRFVDKLVKVRLRSGAAAVLLVHVEVQGERDRAFTARMYRYWSRLRDKHRTPVYSIAVLADDDPDWRPSVHEEAVFGTRLRFEFDTLKLLDLEPRLADLEVAGNPLAMLIAIDLRARRTRPDVHRLNAKTRLLRAILREPRFSDSDIQQLYRLLTWLLVLPQDLETQFETAVLSLEEPRMVILSPMEVRAIEKGRVEGRVEEAREMIRRAVRARFGTTATSDEKIRAALEPIVDIEVLGRLHDSAVTVASRAAFEAVLATHRTTA